MQAEMNVNEYKQRGGFKKRGKLVPCHDYNYNSYDSDHNRVVYIR